ncbi:hypothetical protein PT974_04623 [Cladobotryum mycophilum]|uniref:Uncharacterized protein n=1 Tax=Cladobotryum mycophilum TaxID=491253 RepID=A0ABR0SWN9_9HYPO
MSTINVVKHLMYKGIVPKDSAQRQKLMALGYQTARDRSLYPKAVLIRSGVHGTTRRKRDPKGLHVTLCHKDRTQIIRRTHVASHAYVSGNTNLKLIEATHAAEKPDSIRRKRRKPVWPSEEQLEMTEYAKWPKMEVAASDATCKVGRQVRTYHWQRQQ